MVLKASQFGLFFVTSLSMPLAAALRIKDIKVMGEARFISANESAKQNLCIDGHLAPEFFLIGAQKAATTSFSAMLAHPNLILPHRLPGEPSTFGKELHTFCNEKNFKKGKEFWLSHYPTCTTDTHMVAADMTPEYLQDHHTPWRMKEFYGKQIVQLRFATILRNPAERIHSAYHFYKNTLDIGCEYNNLGQTFYDHMLKIINGSDPCNFIQGSQYVEHFENFLQVFNSSQFITVPFLEVVAPKDGVSRANIAVWESVGLSGEPAKIAHANIHNHTSLFEDLGDEEMMGLFQDYVDEKVNVTEVAKVHIKHNIKVFGYNGHDQDALADFLKKSW